MIVSINEWIKYQKTQKINEGQFSWFTLDGNTQIGNEKENQIPVYMFDNKGNMWFEDNYEGYGVFGGKDYYELTAEMNGIVDGKGIELRTYGIDLVYSDKSGILFPALVESPHFNWKNHDFTIAPEDDPNQGWLVDDEVDEPEDWWGDEEDEYDMYEASTTSTTDDKILNKITRAICNTINDKMGGKITKEIDLKDMILDFMGANGYGEDKKVASQVVKKVKAEFKAKKINEDRYTNMIEEERYYKNELAKITSLPAKVKITDFDGNQTNFMSVSADNCEIFIKWFQKFKNIKQNEGSDFIYGEMHGEIQNIFQKFQNKLTRSEVKEIVFDMLFDYFTEEE